ncbi:protoporphyrinogen oxidase-like protein [Novymonas esmeraldas]|uniref:Protoporphyrinogen oxidase-like protein n=1 Tax=Novymonas esmeraldas TaxID=1808958 RepID=A0AAW0F1E0_9TRYP
MPPQGPKYLMLYSTTDGHTKTIMDAIAKQLFEEAQAQCDVVDIRDGNSYALSDYQKVLIGASIRYGSFSSAFLSYVKQHEAELNTMPSAFFGVNLTARKKEKNTPMTNAYTRKFLTRSTWFPQLTGVFAGALWYPRYNFVDRIMVQLVMRMTGGETDPAKEIVFTDWAVVRKFASDFAALPLTVPPRPKPAPAATSAGFLPNRTGVRLVLLIAGASVAALLGRRLIAARRK